MPVHFSPEEMQAAGLDALLMYKQESMYYLTGYDTFGFSLFQCLVMTAEGRVVLLTRLPDLRQAQYTSDIEDIRIWRDVEGMNPAVDLRLLLEELGLRNTRLGMELDSYGLKARYWRLVEQELAGGGGCDRGRLDPGRPSAGGKEPARDRVRPQGGCAI